MRTETEMISLIHEKAAQLRRSRRRRRAGVMTAAGCLAIAVLALTSSQRSQDDTVLVAASAAIERDNALIDSTTLPGTVLGHLEIPAIDVQCLFVEGVSTDDLALGPGHYPGTALPGHTGNAALAGYRTSNGAPFGRLDELRRGDRIEITTLEGVFVYIVHDTVVVAPDAVEVLDADYWSGQGTAALTLTSEHPASSTRERIVVVALLVDEPVG